MSLKKLSGRILEPFGVGIVAGSVVGNPISSAVYWYWLIVGVVFTVIGIGLVGKNE